MALKDYMERYAAGTLKHKPEKREAVSGVKQYAQKPEQKPKPVKRNDVSMTAALEGAKGEGE